MLIKDWLKSKKSAPKVDETDKEAEERKAKELRQLMAEEKFKEWLSEKVKPGFHKIQGYFKKVMH